MQTVGGAAEGLVGLAVIGVGAATSELGIGIPIMVGGTIIAGHGVSNMEAGTRTALTGRSAQTIVSRGLQATGMSRGQADTADVVIGLVGPGSATQVLRSPQLMTRAVPGAAASPAGSAAGTGAAEGAPVNARAMLQRVTDRAVTDLAGNPGLARELMSPGSYRHLVQGTNLAPATYGKAVERLTGRYIAADPELSRIFQYQSRPFVSTPDFFAYEGQNLRLLDITTRAGISSHLARPYGSYTEYVTHPGLPSNLVFPR
jgi:hypothetical protein